METFIQRIRNLLAARWFTGFSGGVLCSTCHSWRSFSRATHPWSNITGITGGIRYLAIRFFLGDSTGKIPPEVMEIPLGDVAGIMVYISLDEMLPTSKASGKGHDSLFGLLAGMMVMALGLLLMK